MKVQDQNLMDGKTGKAEIQTNLNYFAHFLFKKSLIMKIKPKIKTSEV